MEGRTKTRFQFKLKSLFIAVVVVSIWAALFQVFSWQSQIVLAAIGLTLGFGCRRTRIATVVVSLVMLLPFTWVFWIDFYWSEYHWNWVRMWPSLPGLFGADYFFKYQGGWVETLAASVFTLIAMGIGVLIGRIGRRWLCAVAGIFAVVCLILAYGSFAAFRM